MAAATKSLNSRARAYSESRARNVGFAGEGPLRTGESDAGEAHRAWKLIWTVCGIAAGGPAVEHGGKKAFYTPAKDTIRLPEPTRFENTGQYYATLFHEMAHSTGHGKRLDRKLDSKLSPFGSADYGREELVAEMGAAFLCAQSGIEPVTLANQAAYVKGWLGALKADNRLLIAAGGQAQRAADWILGQRPATRVPESEAGTIEPEMSEMPPI